MERFTKYLLGLCIGLNLTFSAMPAFAQDSTRVTVTIPFDFAVGNKQLKAGNYVVESVLDRKALQFRGKDGNVQQTVFTVPIVTNTFGNHGRLVFHRDSGKYFLSQVWFPAEDGRDLIPGVQERNLAKGQPVNNQSIVGQ